MNTASAGPAIYGLIVTNILLGIATLGICLLALYAIGSEIRRRWAPKEQAREPGDELQAASHSPTLADNAAAVG